MNDSKYQPAVADSVLMTLAGIAYGAAASIPDYLRKAGPTSADWTVAWMPKEDGTVVNFAFMARDDGTGNHVIAIRGTYPNPLSSAYWDNARQDSPFGDMVDWSGAPGAKISAGTADAFDTLLKLEDTHGSTLQQAVAKLPANASVTVTGHSLGGTLTPVLALWLTGQFPDRTIEATSFAGMTPGNRAFAALFGQGTRLAGKVRRVYNSLDSVPYGWDRVLATIGFYRPAPKGGIVVSAFIIFMAIRLSFGGYNYKAVGTPVKLKGRVRPPFFSCNLVAYVIETLHQHMPDTYLSLLDAPPLPFSIVFGSMVLPRPHLEGLARRDRELPVVHVPQ